MKKLLAFLLAIMMIVTFIPSAFATEGEKWETVCDLENLMVALDMYGSECTLPFSTLNYTNTNDVFNYVDSSIDNDLVASKQITYPGAKPGSNDTYDTKGFITLYQSHWISFEVNVPQEGIYSFKVNYKPGKKNGGTMSVYVADASTFDAQNKNFGNKIGDYSCAEGTLHDDPASVVNKEWKTAEMAIETPLAKGKYTFTFQVEQSSNAGLRATIGNFTLTGTPYDPGFSIKYDIGTAMVDNGIHYNEGVSAGILDYNLTNDFFEIAYCPTDISYASTESTTYHFMKLKENSYITFKVNVPEKGIYSLKTAYQLVKDGTKAEIYIDGSDTKCGEYNCYDAEAASKMGANVTLWSAEEIVAENLELEAGEHTITIKALEGDTAGNDFASVSTFKLISGAGMGRTDMGASIKVSDTELAVGETASVEYAKAYLSDGSVDESKTASGTYESSDTSVATVSGTTITAVGAGTADITTTVGDVTAKRTITVVDKAATDEVSTVQFMATSTIANNLGITTDVDGYTVGGTTSDIAPGTTVEVTANPVTGYIFRGWKRGSKDNGVWVSTSSTYSFPLLTNTYLTAIYDVDTATDAAVNVEFYNFNGQFLVSKAVEDKTFETLASDVEPTLTGYNSFFWTIDGDTEIAVDTVFKKLTRVVAKFKDEGRDEFAVTVPSNVESNYNSGIYAYDTEIEMTADAAGLWKVNGEPVAYGNSYTYTVWSKAEITFEVKENDNKPIISIDDNATDGARMISYDANGANIVEAGILFGANAKINSANSRAISREAKGDVSGQFTAKPYNSGDVNSATAYLIYKDGSTYRVIYAD